MWPVFVFLKESVCVYVYIYIYIIKIVYHAKVRGGNSRMSIFKQGFPSRLVAIPTIYP